MLKRYGITQTIMAHRTGWSGAWDALTSAITGKPRYAYPQDIELSVWADRPVTLSCIQAVPKGRQ